MVSVFPDIVPITLDNPQNIVFFGTISSGESQVFLTAIFVARLILGTDVSKPEHIKRNHLHGQITLTVSQKICIIMDNNIEKQ